MRLKRLSVGVLNMVFPKSAVSASDLDDRFVPALLRLADAIGRGSKSWLS